LEDYSLTPQQLSSVTLYNVEKMEMKSCRFQGMKSLDASSSFTGGAITAFQDSTSKEGK